MATIEDEAGNAWYKEEARVKRLNHGVAGAHVCSPFQCEDCWMHNLEDREITQRDELYVKCIRRAQIDSIVGKAKGTIDSHRRTVASTVLHCGHLNKTPSYQPRGPQLLGDKYGMGLAVELLHKSLYAKGRINPLYVQFDCLRKLRSTYTKNWESSPAGVAEGSAFSMGTGRIRPTSCPTQSEWFSDFLRGCENRMGFDTQADHGVSMKALVTLLDYIKTDAENAETVEEENELWKIGAFVCMVTSGSLRGYEGFYADLAGLKLNIHKGRDGVVPDNINADSILSEEAAHNLPHVPLCLIGNFKGEGGINYHMINVASESMSGLTPRFWVEKLIEVCDSEGRVSGPAFADAQGNLASSLDYDAVFRMYLKRVQVKTQLIQVDYNVDVMFSINRTPRKSALTRAVRANIAKKHQDQMNRWRTVENSQGRRPRFNMRQHYSEAVLLMPTTWFYSYVL